MKQLPKFPGIPKIPKTWAKYSLAAYAVSLTVVVLLAVTVGPFREPVHFWTETRILGNQLAESEKARGKLETERNRLLVALKNIQADWTRGQETIRALRELTKNPESEQRLVEANKVADKLSQERSVLILKLNELRQSCGPGGKAAEVESKKLKNP